MAIDFSKSGDPAGYQAFYSAWEKARKDGALPLRRDIQLRAFAQHVENVTILERIKPGYYIHRLFGSQVTYRFGKSDPAFNVIDYQSPDIREKVIEWTEGLLETPCAGFAEFSTAYTDGIHRACQSLSLPTRSSDGKTLLFSFQRAFELLYVSEGRETPCLGLDYSVGTFFDIGFGFPKGDVRMLIGKPKPE